MIAILILSPILALLAIGFVRWQFERMRWPFAYVPTRRQLRMWKRERADINPAMRRRM